MGLINFLRNKSYVAQIVFILIILYTVSSINVLVLALSLIPYLENLRFRDTVLIAFAVISFALTVFISVYHLYTMAYRKKRRSDAASSNAA